MKVFMIGGTGLLGSMAANEFSRQGHQVVTISLPGIPCGAEFPEDMTIIEGNYNDMNDEELGKLMEGCEAFVFAAGVDERVEFPSPVYDSYYKYNVASVKRLLTVAKKVGVTSAVILGSYFTYFNRLHPELELTNRHPYIRSRLEQEKVAFSFAEDGKMNVAVLELPYIFGTQPGRRPLWTMLIERIEKMGAVTMYPNGGTAMVTVRQVGQVIVGAALKNTGATPYPIGMYNYTWDDFLKIVHCAMGKPNRKIIHIPKVMFQMYALNNDRMCKKNGCEMGLNPVSLADIMYMKSFIDSSWARYLGATDDDMHAAIYDSVAVSVSVCKGTAKNLVDMKVK